MTKAEIKKLTAIAKKDNAKRKQAWKDLFPMTVKKIVTPKEWKSITPGWSAKAGDWVAVAPCDEKFGGKTFLGMMIGDIALSVHISYDAKKQHLNVNPGWHNPLMIIPELGELVYGCGSWWHKIEKAEDLRQITNADINNVWYVKALKELDKTATK